MSGGVCGIRNLFPYETMHQTQGGSSKVERRGRQTVKDEGTENDDMVMKSNGVGVNRIWPRTNGCIVISHPCVNLNSSNLPLTDPIRVANTIQPPLRGTPLRCALRRRSKTPWALGIRQAPRHTGRGASNDGHVNLQDREGKAVDKQLKSWFQYEREYFL